MIVCNPASTPIDTLLSESSDVVLPLTHPNSILVLTAACADERLIEHIRTSTGHDLTILSVDPARALQGLRALSISSSPSAVQQYQDDYSGSNVPKFTQLIAQTIPQSGQAVEAVHAETARAVVQDALSACKAQLSRAQSETIVVCDGISSLRARMEEVRVRTSREVLTGEEGGNEVQHAVEQSKKDMKAVLDRLTWWKLLWKVDDVGDTVNDAVSRAWCRDLEYRVWPRPSPLLTPHANPLTSSSSIPAASPTSNAPSQTPPAPSPPLSPSHPLSTRPSCKTTYLRSPPRRPSRWTARRSSNPSTHAVSSSAGQPRGYRAPHSAYCSPWAGASLEARAWRGRAGRASWASSTS